MCSCPRASKIVFSYCSVDFLIFSLCQGLGWGVFPYRVLVFITVIFLLAPRALSALALSCYSNNLSSEDTACQAEAQRISGSYKSCWHECVGFRESGYFCPVLNQHCQTSRSCRVQTVIPATMSFCSTRQIKHSRASLVLPSRELIVGSKLGLQLHKQNPLIQASSLKLHIGD